MTEGRATRPLYAAGALAALGLVVAVVPMIRAEFAYGRARGYGVGPSEDLPGRLEAYAEAERLEPREFLYPFRSGQILLQRDDAEGALEPLRRAAKLQPLDTRVRSALAETLLRLGRTAEAVEQSDHAVRLGPRHPGSLARAVSLRMRLWTSTRNPRHLRAAVATAHASAQVDSTDPVRRLARALALRGGSAVPDLIEALGDDATLFAFAAEHLAAARPDLAAVLAAERRRLERGN